MSKLPSLLRSKASTAILGAVAFLATMAFQMSHFLAASHGPQAPSPSSDYAASTASIAWDYTNTEVEQMIDELRRERGRLQTRAEELDALERRIRSDRTELDGIIQSVRQLQSEFDASILRVQQDEATNLRKLAKVYATMEPASAVGILQELDDYSVVKILLYMKEAEAGPILEALARLGPDEAKRAAGISESLRTATAPNTGSIQPGSATLAKAAAAPKPAPAAKPASPSQP